MTNEEGRGVREGKGRLGPTGTRLDSGSSSTFLHLPLSRGSPSPGAGFPPPWIGGGAMSRGDLSVVSLVESGLLRCTSIWFRSPVSSSTHCLPVPVTSTVVRVLPSTVFEGGWVPSSATPLTITTTTSTVSRGWTFRLLFSVFLLPRESGSIPYKLGSIFVWSERLKDFQLVGVGGE